MQTRAVERRPERPASSGGREDSRQAQNALSTGSPSRSGVVDSGENDASIRVLLTGRRTAKTGAIELQMLKTKAQLQA